MNPLPVSKFTMPGNTAFTSFKENGFFTQEAVFTEVLVAQANNAVVDVMNGIYETGIPPLYMVDVNCPRSINRIGQIHYANTSIRDLLCNPVIGKLVATLSGATSIRLWGSQLYYKPPNQSKNYQIGYHSDAQHFPGILSGGFTLWIPLTTTTPDSGTLRYIVGSHKIKQYIHLEGAQDPDVENQLRRLRAQLGEHQCQEFEVYLPTGGVSIHDQDTLHASLCNMSDKPRVAIAASIVTDKTRYLTAADTFGILDIINDNSCSYEYKLDERLIK